MGRLRVDLALALFAIVFVNCVVQSQYYLENPTHIYVVERPETQSQVSQEQEQESVSTEDTGTMNSQFMSRSGVPQSQEEGDESESQESEEDRHQRAKGRPRPIRLPPNFDKIVKKKLQLAQRQRRPLQGDPSNINEHEDDRQPESRLLWPFSIEVSKGGWGPGNFGSYTSWAQEGWGDKESSSGGGGGGGGEGGTSGWGSYSHPYNNEGWEEEKGLDDDELTKTKHYKKYIKKKRKITKKLKKKHKFVRLIQKILQKHIDYLDKLVPY